MKFLPVPMFHLLARNHVIASNKSFSKTTHLTRLLRSIHHLHENFNATNNQQTISYLVNSRGLSPQSALFASQMLSLRSTHNPDSVLDLLRSHGFSNAQISKLVKRFPAVLSLDLKKKLKPKFDYFVSLGYTGTQLTTLVSSNPHVLEASLNKKLKPNIDLLTSILSGSRPVADAVRRSSSWLLTINLKTNFLPNVRSLQSRGVPGPHIAKLVAMYPRALMRTTAQFQRTVEPVGKMGLVDAKLMTFVQGIGALAGISSSTWERKVAFFRSLGWSEDDVVIAFTRHPRVMVRSEEKIKKVMEFVSEEIDWGPSFVAANPVILTLSLEKRIAPRWRVLKALMSKGLVRSSPVVHFLLVKEIDFVRKFVAEYQDRDPEVLQAYKGNLDRVKL